MSLSKLNSWCTKCGGESNSFCGYCNAPYCSKECQSLNWSSHKFICKEMPPLVTFFNQVERTDVLPARPQMLFEDQVVGSAISPVPSKKSLCEDQVEHAEGSETQSSKSLALERQMNIQYEGQENVSPNAQNSPIQETREFRSEPPSIKIEDELFAVGAENLEVIITDNSALHRGRIGVILSSNMKSIRHVTNYLSSTYVDTKEPYWPQLYEYCLARYEDEWYRGKVLQLKPGNEFTVVYIDFGNVSNMKPVDLRRYPEELKEKCATNSCIIDGLPMPLNNAQIAFLECQLQSQSALTITKVFKVVKRNVYVECRDLIKKMKEEKIL